MTMEAPHLRVRADACVSNFHVAGTLPTIYTLPEHQKSQRAGSRYRNRQAIGEQFDPTVLRYKHHIRQDPRTNHMRKT